MNCDGVFFALRSDFLQQYADASPGAYLNYHILKYLFETSGKRYYMGPGNNPYKLKWTDRFDVARRPVLFSPTVRGRSLELWDRGVVPLAGRLRDKLMRSGSDSSQTKRCES